MQTIPKLNKNGWYRLTWIIIMCDYQGFYGQLSEQIYYIKGHSIPSQANLVQIRGVRLSRGVIKWASLYLTCAAEPPDVMSREGGDATASSQLTLFWCIVSCVYIILPLPAPRPTARARLRHSHTRNVCPTTA